MTTPEIVDAAMEVCEHALFVELERQYEASGQTQYVGNYCPASNGGTTLDGSFDLRACARAVVVAFLGAQA